MGGGAASLRLLPGYVPHTGRGKTGIQEMKEKDRHPERKRERETVYEDDKLAEL